MTNSQSKKEKQARREQERYRQQQNRNKTYSTDDSDYHNSESDEDSDQGWQQNKRTKYRKQRRTSHGTQKHKVYDNITNRKPRHNIDNAKYTMENQPPENNENNYPHIQKTAGTRTNNQQ